MKPQVRHEKPVRMAERALIAVLYYALFPPGDLQMEVNGDGT